MKTFTAWEYLLIDLANHWGLSGSNFEDRIEWAKDNLTQLESLAQDRQWKEKPLFVAATKAIRDVQKGLPTGHLIGLDSASSGLQLMSVLTACPAGCEATGLIDPDERKDAYAIGLGIMKKLCAAVKEATRKEVKMAIMTSYYGSKAEPKKLFGTGEELKAFYGMMEILGPGAWKLLEVLLDSWVPFASEHSWVMPDNHYVKVPVLTQNTARIEVDELDHARLNYIYYQVEGQEKGLSNVANVVHSVDALVARELIRRCSMSRITMVEKLLMLMGYEDNKNTIKPSNNTAIMIQNDLYDRTQFATLYTATLINSAQDWALLNASHRDALYDLLKRYSDVPEFSVITIHDDFRCLPSNGNQLRRVYNDILADLCDSTVLDDLVSQLYGRDIAYAKESNPKLLSKVIRSSNYGLS